MRPPEAGPSPGPPRCEPDAEGWYVRAGLSLPQAEELLDWLEANGHAQREVLLDAGGLVTVRWRRGQSPSV